MGSTLSRTDLLELAKLRLAMSAAVFIGRLAYRIGS
jgi:hypothetical protein